MIHVNREMLVKSVCDGDLGAWSTMLRSSVVVGDLMLPENEDSLLEEIETAVE